MSAAFKKSIALAALAVAVVPGLALAHHSYAAFDREHQVTINGTVLTWEWTNPHSHLQVSAPDKGKPATWDLELSSPNILRSSGWTRESLKPGDKVTVLLYPRKDGIPGGNPITVTTGDGKVYGRQNPGGAGVERQ